MNTFKQTQKSLIKRIISLICIVLTVSLLFQVPAFASETVIEQNAEKIENTFYNGFSEACLFGAAGGGLLGGGVGATGSVIIISLAGGVAGLSAPGITSGLAAIGSIVGGGMAAGVVVSAALPVLAAVTLGTVECGVINYASKNLTGDKTVGESKS